VVEICEASAHVAMLIARSFSVVTMLQRSAPAIEDRLKLAGLLDRCASIGANGVSTLELDADPQAAIRGIVEEARIAVQQDHAEAICLGCAGVAGLEETITPSWASRSSTGSARPSAGRHGPARRVPGRRAVKSAVIGSSDAQARRAAGFRSFHSLPTAQAVHCLVGAGHRTLLGMIEGSSR
jgi:Asp/Glu/Hydantoin racemase